MYIIVKIAYQILFLKYSFSFLFICINNHSYTDIAEITKNIHISIAVSVPFLRSEIPDIFIFILF